jgi:hypothetical protein
MKWTTPFLSAVFALLFIVTQAVAEEPLSMELLERLSVTEDELAPLEDQIAQAQSEAFKEYDPLDAAMLDPATQDRLLDSALKNQGIYDEVETALENNGWDSYGDYVRVNMRLGTLIMHKFHESGLAVSKESTALLEKIPPSQEDLAFREKHWEDMWALEQE